ncbi:MAG TPA: DUF2058 family protein [Luteimonas sp.]|nr:DUF2058 family protein [Luteimonas sp.]
MSDTLRDQLLGLGFKPVPAPEKPRRPPPDASRSQGPARDAKPARATPSPRADRPGRADPPAGANRGDRREARRQQPAPGAHASPRPRAPARTREDIDLAKAYAIRAQREKDERIEAERHKQEQARLRREAKAAVAGLVKDRALNDPAADIARHFEYGGKIKRVYLTASQLAEVNSGRLGVLQLDGRYLVVDAALLAQAEALFAPSVALKVDPSAPAGEDAYADPRYQVPDDLVW